MGHQQAAKVVEPAKAGPELRYRSQPQVSPSPADRILQLQRDAGNRATQRWLRGRGIQAELRVGEPGDRCEQEADRVAESVLRMPDPLARPVAPVFGRPAVAQVQRHCPGCDEEARRQPEEEVEDSPTRRKV